MSNEHDRRFDEAATGPYDRQTPSAYGPVPEYDEERMSHRGGDARRPSRGRRELFQAKGKIATGSSAATAIPDNTNVLQGTKDRGTTEDPFVPRTVYLSVSGKKALFDTVTAGFVTVEVTGHQPGTPWIRVLTLAPGQTQQIKVETFQDVSVRVLHSTALGASLDCVVTEEVSFGTGAEDVAYLAVHYATGTYNRPPGAVSFLPATADPAFAWIAGGPAANITITDAVVAFAEKTAKGPTFTVAAVAGLSVIWKVSML